jgi:hypothetical protein
VPAERRHKRGPSRRGGDSEYQVRLGEVLRTQGVDGLRVFLEASAARFGDAGQVDTICSKSDAELEQMRHQMILSRLDLSDLHAESRRWLFERGQDTYGPGGGRRN